MQCNSTVLVDIYVKGVHVPFVSKLVYQRVRVWTLGHSLGLRVIGSLDLVLSLHFELAVNNKI